MALTIPELFKQILCRHTDRLYRDEADQVLFRNQTYHERCSECGEDTYLLEPNFPNGLRACLWCIINEVADMSYEPDKIEELSGDVEDLQAQCKRHEKDLSKLDDENSWLRIEVTDLHNDVAKRDQLVAEISQECDDLRARVEAFDDDSLALRNENARLKLDMQRMKDRMACHGRQR